jgi:hypothetical protein
MNRASAKIFRRDGAKDFVASGNSLGGGSGGSFSRFGPGHSLAVVVTLALAAVILTGCGGRDGAEGETAAAPVVPPVAPEEVENRIQSAFENAPAEASAAAKTVVDSVQTEDPAALQKLQELSSRGDLTPEQRAVANKSMYALLARLRAAESNGNQKAAAALEQYQLSK